MTAPASIPPEVVGRLTARQAKAFASMKPGVWMTASAIYGASGQTGLTENAAKHANALHRLGLVEKRNPRDPEWRRP